MRRAVLAILAGMSLVVSCASAAAWAVSYARPMDWRAVAYSAAPGWTVEYEQDGITPDEVREPDLVIPELGDMEHLGEWHAWWLRSRRGCLTIAKQDLELGSKSGIIMVDADWLGAVSIPEIEMNCFIVDDDVADVPTTRSATRTEVLDIRAGADDPEDGHNFLARLGFGFQCDEMQQSDDSTAKPLRASLSLLMIPYWAAVVGGLPLPLLWLRTNRRSVRWARQGRCTRCGYDLRASPERCPECGKPC